MLKFPLPKERRTGKKEQVTKHFTRELEKQSKTFSFQVSFYIPYVVARDGSVTVNGQVMFYFLKSEGTYNI